MPIRWSALKVSEAMDMAEEFVAEAIQPLEQVRIVAEEARKLPNIPLYIDQDLTRLIGEIERAIGGRLDPSGRLRAYIKAVRDDLPAGAADSEKAVAKLGSQKTLI